MPEKDPTTFSIVTYAWVLLLASWGGIANYTNKVRNGLLARFSIAELIGDVVVSGFAGVMTFYLCQAAELHPLVTAAFVGISGHMGSKVIFMFEAKLSQWLVKG